MCVRTCVGVRTECATRDFYNRSRPQCTSLFTILYCLDKSGCVCTCVHVGIECAMSDF